MKKDLEHLWIVLNMKGSLLSNKSDYAQSSILIL